jgi:hypothetical protein
MVQTQPIPEKIGTEQILFSVPDTYAGAPDSILIFRLDSYITFVAVAPTKALPFGTVERLGLIVVSRIQHAH